MRRYLIFLPPDWDGTSAEDLFVADCDDPVNYLLSRSKKWMRDDVVYCLDHDTGEWTWYKRVAPKDGTWAATVRP